MDEFPSSGSLQEFPLPQVLYRLWQQKKTGSLVAAGGDEERRLRLVKGLLALEREALDEARFKRHLRRHRLLTSAQLQRSGGPPGSARPSLIRSLIQHGGLEPSRLWRQLELYFQESLAEAFEWPGGRFEFLPAATLDFDMLLAGIPTPDYVLEGIRAMTRLEAAERWLKRENAPWQVAPPAHLSPSSLLPHERYVLSLLAEERTLEDALELSQLPRAETMKVLFALACTGAVGPATGRPRLKTPADFSLADYDKILAHFKGKAAVIFRYISKEVGPVALNIVTKSLEEVNAWLGPASPKVTLNPDGIPEVKSLLRIHGGLFREDDAKNLIRILDEILAAEVLMVKRTLGSEHEAALVRALDR